MIISIIYLFVKLIHFSDGETIFVSKGEDFIPPWTQKDQLVKLSFGGHVFYAHESTLESRKPVSMKIKCVGATTAVEYTRDAAVGSARGLLIDQSASLVMR